MKNLSDLEEPNIILGVDPGTRITGYGIISMHHQVCDLLDYGCIRPPPNLKLSERYLVIFDSIEELIAKHQPHVLVVETQYVHKNVQSALKLGMARGAVMIAAKRKGLSVFEYAPTVAKRAVVGNGKASKFQVQRMVQSLLKLASPPQPEDAADALALAICHAHSASHLRASYEV
jgi:crossover junction endodeoxyribonuclease RuvC